MAKVFISHASKGDVAAQLVHGWLVEDGHQVFLDHDLLDGIELGEEWEQRLHERLRWADAVVCPVTSAYVASAWCTAELGVARSRGEPPAANQRGTRPHPPAAAVTPVRGVTRRRPGRCSRRRCSASWNPGRPPPTSASISTTRQPPSFPTSSGSS
jgi:hypothetical protein